MSRLIDADALMEASKYEFWQDCSAITPIGEYIIGKFRRLIRNMPTVTPKPQWIPVSERLPEKYGEYLVTFIPSGGTLWTYVKIVHYSDLMGIAKPSFHVGNPGKNDFQNITEQVTAWMPLPEPYRGGKENR